MKSKTIVSNNIWVILCEFSDLWIRIRCFKFKSIKIGIRFLSLEVIMLTQSFTSGSEIYSHHDPNKYIQSLESCHRVWTDPNGLGNSEWKQKFRIGEDSRNSESLLQCRWRSRDEPWMEVGLNSQWKVSIYMSIRQGTFSGRRYSYGTLHFLFLKW